MSDLAVSQRYSFRAAFLKEVSENPLRCGLAFLNTIGIGLGVIAYVRAAVFPDSNEAYVRATMTLLSTNAGKELRFSFTPVGSGSVASLRGTVDFESDKQLEIRNVFVFPELPGESLPDMYQIIHAVPERVRLCLQVKSLGGAQTREWIVFEQETAETFRPWYNAGACFKGGE